ncbi:MAG: toll/interleukin-1 receptor domain-containing protein, partial [Pseudomonadota bacterium]
SLVNFLFTQEVLVPPALTEQSGECKEYLIRFFADASDTFIVEKPEVQLAMIMLRVKVQPQKKGRIAMVKEDHEALRTGLMDNTSYPRLATRYLLAMGGAIRKRSERKVRRTPGTTFLSYTKDNAKKARNIVDTLGEKGLNVVYDAQFDPGEPIARQVEVAMINASTAILLLTKEYLNSSWASDERDFLMDKRRRKELRLFVLNDGVTQRQLARKAPLLSGLLHLSGTDADLEESLQRLVEEIGQLNPDRS